MKTLRCEWVRALPPNLSRDQLACALVVANSVAKDGESTGIGLRTVAKRAGLSRYVTARAVRALEYEHGLLDRVTEDGQTVTTLRMPLRRQGSSAHGLGR